VIGIILLPADGLDVGAFRPGRIDHVDEFILGAHEPRIEPQAGQLNHDDGDGATVIRDSAGNRQILGRRRNCALSALLRIGVGEYCCSL
jgi:hypothetical protein